VKYATKEALLRDIDEQYSDLQQLLGGVPASQYKEPDVWGEGWTVHDLIAHLLAWQKLFLAWYGTGQRNDVVRMPAPGYTWSETPRLNRDIWCEYRDVPTTDVQTEFAATHIELRRLAGASTPEALLVPGQFAWTGRSTLATYLAANTASHYRFAVRVLRRWLKTRQRA